MEFMHLLSWLFLWISTDEAMEKEKMENQEDQKLKVVPLLKQRAQRRTEKPERMINRGITSFAIFLNN